MARNRFVLGINRDRQQLCVMALVAAFFACLEAAGTHGATFSGVGQFSDGEFGTFPSAISSDGSTAIGTGERFPNASIFGRDAFLWREDTGLTSVTSPPAPPTPLAPPASYLAGRDISEDGVAITATRWSLVPTGLSYRAVILTAANGEMQLPELPNGTGKSMAEGISADGTTVVGYASISGGSMAFRWTAATGMVGLGDLPGGLDASVAYDVSADGSTIVGTATSDVGPQAFRWTESAGLKRLGDVPGGEFLSFANAISFDGKVVVGGVTAPTGENIEAFRWTEEQGFQSLGDEFGSAGVGSNALAASGDGSTIVGSFRLLNEPLAFVWDAAHGMRDLRDLLLADASLAPQVDDWLLTSVQDISRDGLTLVGTGINPQGVQEGWVLRLDHPIGIPEPSAIMLSIAAIAAIGRVRRAMRLPA
jgi:probable HAF family extracellular repeat protein